MVHREISGVASSPAVELVEHSLHDSMDLAHLVLRQADDCSAGVDSDSPQNLVDEHVAETGHHRLIEQNGLHGAPATAETFAKRSSIHRPCVGTETGAISTRTHSSESTRIGDDEPTPTEIEPEAQPSVVVRCRIHQLVDRRSAIDHDASGHTEMEIDRRLDAGRGAEVEGENFAVATSCEHPPADHQIGHRCVDDKRVPMAHGRHATTDDRFGRPPERLDFEDLGHRSILPSPTWETSPVADIALAVLVGAACIAMLVAASRMEPHWVSKDGQRFIARMQSLGMHDTPEGPWREMRVLVDGNSLIVGSRGFRGARLRGHYSVVAKSPDPPRKRAIYVISGPQKALLRLPETSRAVPHLDGLLARRVSGPNPGTE